MQLLHLFFELGDGFNQDRGLTCCLASITTKCTGQESSKGGKSTKCKPEQKQGESKDAAGETVGNGGSGADCDGMVSSKDAYVLVYRRKGFRNDPQGQQAADGEGRMPALDAELTKYIDTVNSELKGRTSAYEVCRACH